MAVVCPAEYAEAATGEQADQLSESVGEWLLPLLTVITLWLLSLHYQSNDSHYYDSETMFDAIKSIAVHMDFVG